MGGAPGLVEQEASFSAGIFRALRESNLRLLESVPRARWVECYGVHEVRGRQTVEEFIRLEAAHDLNHLRQIDGILGGWTARQSGWRGMPPNKISGCTVIFGQVLISWNPKIIGT